MPSSSTDYPFFFKPVGKYRKQMVKSFYENMVVVKKEERIISQVRRMTVEQVEILTKHPKSINPNESGKYVQEKLRSKYCTLNKVVHYNLSPFSLEKTPTRYDGKVLIVFGSVEHKVDWAWWIWEEMKNFKNKGKNNGNIPFPVMITKLCHDAGCKPTSGDSLSPTSPRPINGGTLKKSESASQPPRTETLAASLPTATNKHERIEQWFRIIHARQQIILENQQKLKIEQRGAKRREGKLIRFSKWMMACEGRGRGAMTRTRRPRRILIQRVRDCTTLSKWIPRSRRSRRILRRRTTMSRSVVVLLVVVVQYMLCHCRTFSFNFNLY
ncbi:hypothetical protein Vadar_012048 [Vaccinium darrowii]|uniref:Uncharacterized protein n=1 Tax=Vaccinium darrowii TaxID=229202 RepID=A0ACB7ZB88_9ERIC|nr:hypothetical protein Vadar_012048 [Vaccinium darrowii]